ncbi:MAG TPA: acyl-CoA dehydrogenase family protein [Candidatus Dormibacteraeota bacterium]|nr:acyl-CoA dehydrogenase family protein [Candidatus Dormibacteraeota bacterium]
MEFAWSEEDRSFRRELREFLAATLPPGWVEREADPSESEHVAFSRQYAKRLAERGWLTPHWPREYGGQEATPWRMTVLAEELWAHGEPRGPQYMNVNWIGPTIMAHGSDEQKRYHLPRIAGGDVIWCQGFSEPNAGSDLTALSTKAVRDGDVYVVNGQKIWTSYANEAEFCFLLVRTGVSGDPREGITILLTPMGLPGIEVRDIGAVVGEHAFHEVFFSDVRVPVDCRLGDEGRGWDLVRTALSRERVGSRRYTRTGATVDRTASWARDHDRFDDSSVQERLAEAWVACEVARVLSYKVVDEVARGETRGASASLARVAATRADQAAGNLCVDLMGVEGLAAGGSADVQYRRLALVAGIAAGATEVQLDLIARGGLRLPRQR